MTISILNQAQYPQPVVHSVLKFPGGELQVKIADDLNGVESFDILAEIKSSDDIMELLLVTDAIRQKSQDPVINLFMPYIPYARQDRVCAFGEAFSLKVFTRILNSLKYDQVTVVDAHSDVALALIDNVINVTQAQIVGNSGVNFTDHVLVAPDAGAIKKVNAVAKWISTNHEVVRAEKIRNVENGEITDTIVYTDHVGDRDFLIVDDICDGGRTFIELAKKLREKTTGKIYLFVSHGIFSKGLDVFEGLIDGFYVANLMNPSLANNPQITIV